ncbi:MAG TPA: hypothetical protein DDW30_07330 [Clostridiales bacterium]|nr:hypothetical protein [Clostridiales bacterium]
MGRTRFITLVLFLSMILLTVSSPVFASHTDLAGTPKKKFNPRIYIRTDKPILSEMTAEEQYDFLVGAGVAIPAFVQSGISHTEFIASVIEGTEIYPNYDIALIDSTMLSFGAAIRDAVNAYYCREPLLSQFSEEEQLRILRDYGVDFPEKLWEQYRKLILTSVSYSERYNHTMDVINNPIGLDINEMVHAAVSAYYEDHPLALETLAYLHQSVLETHICGPIPLLDSDGQLCGWEEPYK